MAQIFVGIQLLVIPLLVNVFVCHATKIYLKWESIIVPFKVNILLDVINCIVACQEGTGPDRYGRCNCTEGWTGIGCVQCLDDEACARRFRRMNGLPPDANVTAYCDRTLFPQKLKHYDCDIHGKKMSVFVDESKNLKCNKHLEILLR